MSKNTSIEWTDDTFNIAWGCIEVSPGCQNCYARTFAKRTGHDVWGPAKTTARRVFGEKHWNEPLKWNAAAAADPSGGVCPEIPGRLVFCSSMADVFENHPMIDAEREKLWPLIRATPFLTWQLLTKRPERIAANLPSDWGEGYPNVWLGTSVESQEYVSRIDALIDVPAKLRFLSCEPLLGPVDLKPYLWRKLLHWVIPGGESGGSARVCNTIWIQQIIQLCESAGVPVLAKQMGAKPTTPELTHWRAPAKLLDDRSGYALKLKSAKGGDWSEWPAHLRVRQFPVAAALNARRVA